jgi:hypothetical protein
MRMKRAERRRQPKVTAASTPEYAIPATSAAASATQSSSRETRNARSEPRVGKDCHSDGEKCSCSSEAAVFGGRCTGSPYTGSITCRKVPGTVQERSRKYGQRLAVHGVEHLPLSTRVATLARVAAAVARRNGGEDGRMYARGDGHLAGGDGGDEGEQARDGEEEEGDERLDVFALRRARRHRGLLGRKQQLGAALARARVADVAGTVPARVRHSDGAAARHAAAAGAAP